MTGLPDPVFVRIDPATDTAEMVVKWEELTQAPLFPAQVERLLINLLGYRENLVRVAIDYAAKQNLVNFATGPNLDQLGALLDVTRLPEAQASTTLQFTLSALRGSNTVIPTGTRATPDGTTFFATTATLTITAGSLIGTVSAQALTAGTVGNGFAPGEWELVDPISGIAPVTMTVANITTSANGADTESDDRLRDRIKLAPNRFSVAGPVGAYKFWALSANQTIIDVGVLSPSRVFVNVYPLVETGLPSQAILDAVFEILDNDKIRPLTDEVFVLAPTEVQYTLQAQITALASADSPSLQEQLEAAAQVITTAKRSKLGQDIVRSQFIQALQLPGVYSVNLIQPSVDTILNDGQWANCTQIQVSIVGVANG